MSPDPREGPPAGSLLSVPWELGGEPRNSREENKLIELNWLLWSLPGNPTACSGRQQSILSLQLQAPKKRCSVCTSISPQLL